MDPITASVTPIVHLNPQSHRQVNHAAADGQWIVYDIASDGEGNTSWSLFAYNVSTRKTYRMYTTPSGYQDFGAPEGLYVEGNQCIWSNSDTQEGSDRIVSTIHEYDLLHQKDSVLVQMENEPENESQAVKNAADVHTTSRYGVIYWAAAGGGKVIYSVFNGKDVMDSSPDGDLYEYDLQSKQTTHLLHLYHAASPMCSYGDEVVMEDDVDGHDRIDISGHEIPSGRR
ncbi:hypothetical protein GCM10025857_20340 [Alicyclobacillus contaminans]|uniref:hypothetical protein n=1 Tax=Alicyclobacillus contaminans TaxID=392016 RepID=UPI00054D6B3F|nr:hypothetical protein [Alicyclobacillus contaminans]GMA50677.1 hypothetical protein GCM10025857_20340 [Alicyclobacillus contaminans]